MLKTLRTALTPRRRSMREEIRPPQRTMPLHWMRDGVFDHPEVHREEARSRGGFERRLDREKGRDIARLYTPRIWL